MKRRQLRATLRELEQHGLETGSLRVEVARGASGKLHHRGWQCQSREWPLGETVLLGLDGADEVCTHCLGWLALRTAEGELYQLSEVMPAMRQLSVGLAAAAQTLGSESSRVETWEARMRLRNVLSSFAGAWKGPALGAWPATLARANEEAMTMLAVTEEELLEWARQRVLDSGNTGALELLRSPMVALRLVRGRTRPLAAGLLELYANGRREGVVVLPGTAAGALLVMRLVEELTVLELPVSPEALETTTVLLKDGVGLSLSNALELARALERG